MGSPVFSVIVEAVLQRLEDTSKSSYRPLFWTHYVDDAFDIVEPEKLTSFQSALNSVYPDIQLTMEEEKTQELPFLDALIHRRNFVQRLQESSIQGSYSALRKQQCDDTQNNLSQSIG